MKINNKIKSIFHKKKNETLEPLRKNETLKTSSMISAKFSGVTENKINMMKKELKDDFLVLIKDCDAYSEKMTLSPERAEEFLITLLNKAVSKRLELADDLKSHVETGNIFDYFEERIEEIDHLHHELTTNLRYKKYAEKNYEYEKAIYEKIISNTYISNYTPDKQDLRCIRNDNKEMTEELFRDLSKIEESEDCYEFSKDNLD